MIVQRRISMTRNKITRSFVLHKNRKTKDAQMYFINILAPFPEEMERFEIEYVLRKETEILVKQIFTFFAFVFHIK